ncbi:hypothetical protein ANN_27475, partial [Periplaneta americana]
VMNVIKMEREIYPLAIGRSNTTDIEEENSLFQKRNLLDEHISGVKEEDLNQNHDLTTEMKFEEDPMAISFSVMKREPEVSESHCVLPVDNKTKLQRAHNLCVRFVSNVRKYDHITPSLEAIGWLKLDKKRNLHSLLLLFEILNSSIPSYLSSRFTYLSSHHNLNTRSRHETILTIPSHRTSSYSSSFTIALPRLWNSLPASIK